MNTKILLSLLSAAVVLPLSADAESVKLVIPYPPADTVTVSNLNVIAVTQPGAVASINGEDAHVYKTGSFGAPVALAMGDNTIDINVSCNGVSESRTLRVYRKEAKANEPKTQADDMMFAAPFTVTTTPGAFLVYGNGDDRLGGSKMGFIAEGIPLRVTGKNGDLYRVQLSQHRYAYVEKNRVEAAADRPMSPVNTGTWNISDAGRADRITVALPRKLPYRSWTLIDPNTICIELFGAMDNSNWMVQQGRLGVIDYAYFEQPESDVYRIVIRLKTRNCWGYSIGYNGNNLIIDVRHQPASLKLKDLTIGLDAGHGGKYPGAISPSGITEKEVNLDIIFRLKALLEKAGAQVVMTRDGDTGPTMAQRKQTWLDGNIDLAISVHNNSGGSPFQPMGTSVYYKHLFDRPLAQCMHNRMIELGFKDYGLTGNFNFSLNGPTDYPNVLIEGLFMSNLAEEEMLASPEWRQRIAQQIYQGLLDYLAKQQGDHGRL